jgi:hypothetical protein
MLSIAQMTTRRVASASSLGSSGSIAMTPQVPAASSVIRINARRDDARTTRTGGGQCMRRSNRDQRLKAIGQWT